MLSRHYCIDSVTSRKVIGGQQPSAAWPAHRPWIGWRTESTVVDRVRALGRPDRSGGQPIRRKFPINGCRHGLPPARGPLPEPQRTPGPLVGRAARPSSCASFAASLCGTIGALQLRCPTRTEGSRRGGDPPAPFRIRTVRVRSRRERPIASVPVPDHTGHGSQSNVAYQIRTYPRDSR